MSKLIVSEKNTKNIDRAAQLREAKRELGWVLSKSEPIEVVDMDKNQFTCKCGWVSEFPADFIGRYKEKWNK